MNIILQIFGKLYVDISLYIANNFLILIKITVYESSYLTFGIFLNEVNDYWMQKIFFLVSITPDIQRNISKYLFRNDVLQCF